jgi:1-acyl-sn-glycerol-3-phosphate acyltransferase
VTRAPLIVRQTPGATWPERRNSILRGLARLISRALYRLSVNGAEKVPCSGGVLLCMNHLGGGDGVLIVAFAPRPLTGIGKAEILKWPLVGWIAQTYGMLPIRRGEPDRATLQAALDVLRAGGALALAPEGRESPTGALILAKDGAAFLALHSGVPIVPVALTGTAWTHVLGEWRRLRRPRVTLTFGSPFDLPLLIKRKDATRLIMRRIASLLPPEYRGVYREADDEEGD